MRTRVLCSLLLGGISLLYFPVPVHAFFLETTLASEPFRFGVLYLNNSLDAKKHLVLFEKLFISCFSKRFHQDIVQYHDENGYLSLLKHRFHQYFGKNLYEVAISDKSPYSPEVMQLSDQLNICNIELQAERRNRNQNDEGNEKYLDEAFLQMSLLLWPNNYASAKNYAFMLEYSGATKAAESLYYDCYQLTGDQGCSLHYLMVTPIVHVSYDQTEIYYFLALRKFFHYLLKSNHHHHNYQGDNKNQQKNIIPNFHEQSIGLQIIRAMPLNTQYLGFSAGRLFELFSLSLIAAFPQIEDSFIQFTSKNPFLSLPSISSAIEPSLLSPAASPVAVGGISISKETQEFLGLFPNTDSTASIPLSTPSNTISQGKKPSKKKLRFGIVSEQLGNTSPGLCVQHIFRYLPQFFPDSFEIIFFDHMNLITVFSDWMKEIAQEVYVIRQDDLHFSRQQILSAKIDILLYLALPTDKLNYLLAHLRLAPIQMVMGFGHPLSSGIRSIDYTIIPEAMLEPSSLIDQYFDNPMKKKALATFPVKDSISCAFEAYYCHRNLIKTYERNVLLKEEYYHDINALIHIDGLRDARYYHYQHDLHNLSKHSLFHDCELSSECYERGAPLYYNEQVVRFQSYGHYLENPLNYYEEYPSLKKILIQFQNYRPFISFDYFVLLKYLNNEYLQYNTSELQLPAHHFFFNFHDHLSISGVTNITTFFKDYYFPIKFHHQRQRYQPDEEIFIHEEETSFAGMTCEEINHLFQVMSSPDFSVSFQMNLDGSTTGKGKDEKKNNEQTNNNESRPKHLHSIIYPQIKAEYLGCYSSIEEKIYFPKYHYYNLIQHLKKYHPLLDDILIRIIHDDKQARIIIKDSYKLILPRLYKRYNEFYFARSLSGKNNRNDRQFDDHDNLMNDQQLLRRKHFKPYHDFQTHFIFIPNYFNHFNYLILLSISHVFLNPIPFGSGITSHEAIQMNLPTLIYPQETSIIHFNAAQIERLFDTKKKNQQSFFPADKFFSQLILSKLLIAKDIDDYVKKAIQIVSSQVISLNQFKWIIAQRKQILLNEEIIRESVEEWGRFLLQFRFLNE